MSIVKSFQATYWQAALKGMDQAVSELGKDKITYTAQGPNSESDIADQVNMLNSAISSKPNGIGLAACDAESVKDSLNQAKTASIPVVLFDTGVAGAPDGTVAATIATDNARQALWQPISSMDF
jgi:ribose transport system substrate-binding protein